MNITNEQKNRLPEILANIQISNEIEGLQITEEIRALCLSVVNGDISLDDSLRMLNAKYS